MPWLSLRHHGSSSADTADRSIIRNRRLLLATVGAALVIAGVMVTRSRVATGKWRWRSDPKTGIKWAPVPSTWPDAIYTDPVWSPDGKSIYFWQQRLGVSSSPYEIVRLDLASGDRHLVAEGSDFDISPDGRWLVYQPNDDYLTVKDLESGAKAKIRQRGVVWPTWWGAGRLIYWADYARELRLVHVPGFRQETLLRSRFRPLWSMAPNGTRLAACLARGRLAEVLVIDLQTHRTLRIAEAECKDPPEWSPDSRWVAFTAVSRPAEAGAAAKVLTRIYLYDVKTASLRLLTGQPDESDPCWSPVGKRLAYVRRLRPPTSALQPQPRYEVCVRDLDRKKTTVLASSDGLGGMPSHKEWGLWWKIKWSPDGRWLCYRPVNRVANERSRGAVGLVRSDGAVSAVVSDPPLIPADWAPDSTRLVCVFPSSKANASSYSPYWVVDVASASATGRGTRRVAGGHESNASRR